jgi:hypothetical protein
MDKAELMIVTTEQVQTGMGSIDEVFGLVYASGDLPVSVLGKLSEQAAELGANAIVGFRLSEGGSNVTAYGTAVRTTHNQDGSPGKAVL